MKTLRRLAVTLLFVCTSAVLASDFGSQVTWLPKDGVVPNAETAVRIAEAVWLPVYGKDIYSKKPFKAKLVDGVWHVEGSLPAGAIGGVPHARIDKKTGAVLGIIHTQ